MKNEQPVHMPAFWADSLNISRSEARRVIAQGGQQIDGEVVRELDIPKTKLRGAVTLGKRHA